MELTKFEDNRMCDECGVECPVTYEVETRYNRSMILCNECLNELHAKITDELVEFIFPTPEDEN